MIYDPGFHPWLFLPAAVRKGQSKRLKQKKAIDTADNRFIFYIVSARKLVSDKKTSKA